MEENQMNEKKIPESERQAFITALAERNERGQSQLELIALKTLKNMIELKDEFISLEYIKLIRGLVFGDLKPGEAEFEKIVENIRAALDKLSEKKHN